MMPIGMAVFSRLLKCHRDGGMDSVVLGSLKHHIVFIDKILFDGEIEVVFFLS